MWRKRDREKTHLIYSFRSWFHSLCCVIGRTRGVFRCIDFILWFDSLPDSIAGNKLHSRSNLTNATHSRTHTVYTHKITHEKTLFRWFHILYIFSMFKQNGRLKSIYVHEYVFIETSQRLSEAVEEKWDRGERERSVIKIEQQEQ